MGENDLGLTAAELRCGQEITVEQFNRKFRPHLAETVRGSDYSGAEPGKAQGHARSGAGAFSGNGRDTRADSVGQA